MVMQRTALLMDARDPTFFSPFLLPDGRDIHEPTEIIDLWHMQHVDHRPDMAVVGIVTGEADFIQHNPLALTHRYLVAGLGNHQVKDGYGCELRFEKGDQLLSLMIDRDEHPTLRSHRFSRVRRMDTRKLVASIMGAYRKVMAETWRVRGVDDAAYAPLWLMSMKEDAFITPMELAAMNEALETNFKP